MPDYSQRDRHLIVDLAQRYINGEFSDDNLREMWSATGVAECRELCPDGIQMSSFVHKPLEHGSIFGLLGFSDTDWFPDNRGRSQYDKRRVLEHVQAEERDEDQNRAAASGSRGR